MVTNIDGKLFASMIVSAANNLENCKQRVNEMNVFPVPDGDTGTNMAKTMSAASAEVLKNPGLGVGDMAKSVASAALRGARGNSGVILSQLLRGLAKGMENCKTADVNTVADGFMEAKAVAYRAVMKPTEGTILTVARIAAETADKNRHMEDMCEFLTKVILAADAALKQTPEMLPVLKTAGVVDSGGMGLVKLLEGALFAALHGSEVELSEEQATEQMAVAENLSSEDFHVDSKFGYCTEFIILKNNPECRASTIEKELKKIGDCVLVIDDDGFAKVHVHTDAPGVALTLALTIGSLTDIKIDNLREEEQEMRKAASQKAEPEKDFGFVGVCAGEGLAEILKSTGIDRIIEGGQTMNPCADDILGAVDSVNAKTVFVFPNNKNIILAARQAAEIESDKRVIIIPPRNVPQNIAALLSFDPSLSAEEEQYYLQKYLEGDLEAKHILIERNLRLVAHVIKKYQHLEENPEDLISIGTIGLIKAIITFNYKSLFITSNYNFAVLIILILSRSNLGIIQFEIHSINSYMSIRPHRHTFDKSNNLLGRFTKIQ